VALNGIRALMTAAAVLIFIGSEFLAGAWVVIAAIPVLMTLFARTEGYYAEVARELKLGNTPPPPRQRESVVVVPTTTVSLMTERGLSAALSMSWPRCRSTSTTERIVRPRGLSGGPVVG
jgi:hypothetical protein